MRYEPQQADVMELIRQGDLREMLRMEVAQRRAAMKVRRAAVLAHEDLAEQLTAKPMALMSPQSWSGFIPPASVETKHESVMNVSPYRAQVVALVAEAQRRDGRDYGVPSA